MNPSVMAVSGSILVVDSSKSDRERLSAELRALANAPVLTATALQEVAWNELDVYLLVLAMDSDVAVNVVQTARRQCSAPIVATGYLTAPAAFAVARAGADAFIPKPLRSEQLLKFMAGAASRCGMKDNDRVPEAACASLARVEWEYLHTVLSSCGGNRSEAARRLRMHRSVLQRKLARHPPAR